MAKIKTADFLVEVGTEELPPKALKSLMDAFAANLQAELLENRLAHGELLACATPRRLAVLVDELALAQPDREVELKGPPVSVAFDKEGIPRPAALAFAKKCGVDVAALGRVRTDKGEWLNYQASEQGAPAEQLLPGIVQASLDRLPVPRRMRWGASDMEFVRPVHWLVMLHGKNVVEAEILGVRAGNQSRGHRFHAPGALTIGAPDQYLSLLEKKGFVIADFAERRQRIVEKVDSAARNAGGRAGGDLALFDEVAALTEWPVAITGSFDEAFLKLPKEVIVATLTDHQRYFPVSKKSGELMPVFVTVANIESADPSRVRDGNERVIRPRLADAAFFWDTDRRSKLVESVDALASVVYQQGLGSMADKSRRVAALADRIAAATGSSREDVQRAALLAKCDLLSGMVGEFPELQGVMGRYYAEADGEAAAVAAAIGEHYLPRFAGDVLPATPAGMALAIADKLDTLAGIFALDKKPTGSRDPFGLRRAALGLIRIIIENDLELDLDDLVARAVKAQPAKIADRKELTAAVYEFIIERLRAWYLERAGLGAEMFESVRSRRPVSLLDFDRRLKAVAAFCRLEEASSLAAANKRIGNILRQANGGSAAKLKPSALVDAAEVELHAALLAAKNTVAPLLAKREYTEALGVLAGLRAPIDRFFDDVMVMSDDPALQKNRLALLGALRDQFLDIADISLLAIS
ncbi:MAG: glycine--tRNA ligase subunit beta [Gammaproteobacteria bacterium]|nr:glycine--tRNA ligase subunit beta [Gammaproteobacteria bacterium]MDH4315610.1 glycine--tRNA ligase subunit beta [Gammaproteobacteria bacterium]MDH5214833.1 glycine--tRNA ligase subunit beta [Gammaproteobacteria bacterium]MDH5499497.1 glycine--tRNA ligase subunit beta [Gammaproteobacteria bacterium]